MAQTVATARFDLAGIPGLISRTADTVYPAQHVCNAPAGSTSLLADDNEFHSSRDTEALTTGLVALTLTRMGSRSRYPGSFGPRVSWGDADARDSQHRHRVHRRFFRSNPYPAASPSGIHGAAQSHFRVGSLVRHEEAVRLATRDVRFSARLHPAPSIQYPVFIFLWNGPVKDLWNAPLLSILLFDRHRHRLRETREKTRGVAA